MSDKGSMSDAYILDGVRTPVGRYGGALSSIRTDDLAALPIREILTRNQGVDWGRLDEVVLGCANQAGEDNRNIARMALLLAGLPESVPGSTINRLCASGLDAIGIGARAIRAGEASLVIAGGVESMSRAPFVIPKSETGFGRKAEIFDTTIGWRFINAKFQESFGTHSMPETADNVANDFDVSREDQDAFALRSQERWARAHEAGRFASEICAVEIHGRKGETRRFETDEHPRPDTKLESLGKLKPINGEGNSVTAGNASGVNDGAAALLIGSEQAGKAFGLEPKARILGMRASGVAPRIMGIGPVDATRKLLESLKLGIDDMDIIELNEAFAAQAIAVLRALGVDETAEHVNPNGGAIAMGHPLGMSGARLVLTATHELIHRGGRYALCTMCVGVGQGVAMVIERV